MTPWVNQPGLLRDGLLFTLFMSSKGCVRRTNCSPSLESGPGESDPAHPTQGSGRPSPPRRPAPVGAVVQWKDAHSFIHITPTRPETL